MSTPGPPWTRRLDEWADEWLARRHPRAATLTSRTLYRYIAVATTLAWLALRIPRWGPRELRLALGGIALYFIGLLLLDQVVTGLRERRRR